MAQSDVPVLLPLQTQQILTITLPVFVDECHLLVGCHFLEFTLLVGRSTAVLIFGGG